MREQRQRGAETLERGRGGETYSISSYQCRAWRCVAFCFAFNKHIYTSPSHWMWFKGWLESVDSRPEYTPFPKYTRPMSKLHTHTHTHISHTPTYAGWLNLLHNFAHVQACPLHTGTFSYNLRATQGHVATHSHVWSCLHTVLCMYASSMQTSCYADMKVGVHSR